ncbi:hypothetical protein SNE40_018245 [Patella caerulea]|uniref:Endonuclease/exonuclease/phosphatase domain-containing protein n=1 Tax=Patella caerulea TaxID=87958 RepID=A0AAN8JAB6_PATCE
MWAQLKLPKITLILGVIYIPPENSKYSSLDAFTQIENELINFLSNNSYVILTGDFNSRIGNDDGISNFNYDKYFDFSDSAYTHSVVNVLNELNIQTHRICKDTNKNQYGSNLIQLCKNNDLIIMNGRMNKDITGKLTCKNSSTVDYTLCTSELIKLVKEFDVLEFSCLISDAHCPLRLTLNLENSLEVKPNLNLIENTITENICIPRKWASEKKVIFIENMKQQSDEINSILLNICNCSPDVVSVKSIDDIMSDICNRIWDQVKKV